MRLNLGRHKRSRLKRAGCGSSKTLLHSDIAISHGKMLADDYRKRLGKLPRDAAHERLRLLTVLHAVVRLDNKAVMGAVARMESALSRAFDGVGAWTLGAVEVEVVNIALLRSIGAQGDDEARKLSVLESIRGAGFPAFAPQDSGVLVHFHGVMDLGSNWLLCEGQLRNRAKKISAWRRSPYQVELKRLFKDRTVLRNLGDIAACVTKGGNDQLRYIAGFGRDLAEDLDARMGRAGTGRAGKGAETVFDARGLTVGEIAFLDEIWRQLMNRKRNKRGYLVRLGG